MKVKDIKNVMSFTIILPGSRVIGISDILPVRPKVIIKLGPLLRLFLFRQRHVFAWCIFVLGIWDPLEFILSATFYDDIISYETKCEFSVPEWATYPMRAESPTRIEIFESIWVFNLRGIAPKPPEFDTFVLPGRVITGASNATGISKMRKNTDG